MKSPSEELAAQRCGNREGQAARAPDQTEALLGSHREAEREEQPQHWILAIETAEREALDRHADERNADRREHHRAAETEALLHLVGEVRAECVERTVGEVYHSAQAEDQRQSQRQDDVVRPDEQPVEDLLEEDERSSRRSRDAAGVGHQHRDGRPRYTLGRRRREGHYAILHAFSAIVG